MSQVQARQHAQQHIDSFERQSDLPEARAPQFESERLNQWISRVRNDAANQPESYLEETRVPEGGE